MSTSTMGSQVREHMEVVCSKGMHVGTADHMQGDELKLTWKDSEEQKHHFVPASLIAKVDDKVHLSKTCDEVKAMWRTE